MKKLLIILLYLPLLYACNPKIDKVLIKVAEEINNSCPMFVDEETRLDYVEVDKDGFVHYVYTFPVTSKSDIDIPSFYFEKSQMLNNEYKSNPGLNFFRENNVTLRYTYFDMYNNQVLSLLIPVD